VQEYVNQTLVPGDVFGLVAINGGSTASLVQFHVGVAACVTFTVRNLPARVASGAHLRCGLPHPPFRL